MAPEQVLGKPVNHLADIYAFGILLFELITGAKPLNGESLERVFWLVLNEPVDLAPLREAGAPEGVVDLVRRCTDKNPAARPQSFTEVRRELEAISSGEALPVRTTNYVQAPQPQSPMATAVLTAAVPASSRPDAPEVEAPAEPQATRKLNRKALAIGAIMVALAGAGTVFLLRPKPAADTAVSKTGAATKAEAPPPATLSFPSGDMVLVPGGTFLFGKEKTPRDTPAYYVDRTAVTNASYAEFLKAANQSPPRGFKSAAASLPVVNVSIKDARGFARWAGKRLPTSVEWEKAARGTDGRTYPWGDNAETKADEKIRNKALRPAAMETVAASPYGALQMVGNVFELVDQSMPPTPEAIQNFAALLTPKPTVDEPWCMIRGGSFKDPVPPVFESGRIPERFHSDDIGFRCVRDIK